MSSEPDLIIWGAHFRTLDDRQPFCTAVAVKDGVIVSTGDDDAVRALRGAGTQVIDGRGIAFVPGLTDSHLHPISSSIATRGVDLFDAVTLEDLWVKLRAEAATLGPQDWVIGWGLHYEMFGPTGIRGDLLDDAVGGRPTYLRFFDGHSGVANQAALAIAGVTGPVEFSETSTVTCDENGVPTGELLENAAMHLVWSAVPALSPEAEYERYKATFRRFAESGLTYVHAMEATPEEFAIYQQLEDRGDLTCRVVVPLWQHPQMTVAEMRDQIPLRDEKGKYWRCGAVKFFIDGVIETGTGWLTHADTRGDGMTPFWPNPEAYAGAVSLFAEAGFQCITHSVGDGGVRWALNSYEAARAYPQNGLNGPHRIEHDELVEPVDVPRFAELNVVASMQPLHMSAYQPDGSDEWADRAGPERTARAFPTRSLLDAGVTLALGSDWSVAPFDPRIGMAWVRLRRTPGRPDMAPRALDQALSGLETLHGYTTGAAAAIAESDLSGRIAPGYRGDLTGFAADPVDTDGDALVDLPILMTVMDGRVTHRAV
ncbi:MAG: amidohydrolase [Thermomicrobiales bacterium]|nr:amidohydrolase [Thermomicrobiales bacterium]